MLSAGHSAKSSHTLSLASCCYDNSLVLRVVLDLIYINKCVLRYLDTLKLLGNVNDADHTSALDHNLSAALVGSVDDLLNSVNVGSKGSNDDPGILMLLKESIQSSSDSLLGSCKAGTLSIGGIAHKGQNTLLSDLSKTLKINGIAEYRCIVNLKVSCVNHGSCR